MNDNFKKIPLLHAYIFLDVTDLLNDAPQETPLKFSSYLINERRKIFRSNQTRQTVGGSCAISCKMSLKNFCSKRLFFKVVNIQYYRRIKNRFANFLAFVIIMINGHPGHKPVQTVKSIFDSKKFNVSTHRVSTEI